MKNFYDFIVIGAGISACTFASSINKKFPDFSVLLIEHGRRLGGRSSTRKSRKSFFLQFDHGLPSLSFSRNISPDLIPVISPLINSKKLVDITEDILEINEYGDLVNILMQKNIYRCIPYMINFSEAIIQQSRNLNKIDFLFKTLVKKIIYNNSIWKVYINDKTFIRSKNLILSSSLLAHPRSFKSLNINSIPLRDAIIAGKDEIVDSLLRKTRILEYLKRKNYIFYSDNFEIVRNFKYNYLQIFFSKCIRDSFNFERIIFHKQHDGSMILVLHCFNNNKYINTNINNILNILINIFSKHQNFLDVFLSIKLIDTMIWRASQPLNNLVPKDYQWSPISNIGFCGDWFDFGCCGSIESSMKSSIRLSNIIF